jgi:hypothetical protein
LRDRGARAGVLFDVFGDDTTIRTASANGTWIHSERGCDSVGIGRNQRPTRRDAWSRVVLPGDDVSILISEQVSDDVTTAMSVSNSTDALETTGTRGFDVAFDFVRFDSKDWSSRLDDGIVVDEPLENLPFLHREAQLGHEEFSGHE